MRQADHHTKPAVFILCAHGAVVLFNHRFRYGKPDPCAGRQSILRFVKAGEKQGQILFWNTAAVILHGDLRRAVFLLHQNGNTAIVDEAIELVKKLK